jgi:hypothetical protein
VEDDDGPDHQPRGNLDGYQDASGRDIGRNDLVPTCSVRTTNGGMPPGIYFASATKLLRCGTNLPSGIYLAPPAPSVRYSANLPFRVYLAPARPPLRHTLIAVVGARAGNGLDARKRRSLSGVRSA